MKKILIYLGDYQDKRTILEPLLTEMQIAYRFLQEEDLQQQLGYLLELEGYEKQPVSKMRAIGIDLMFLDEISDEEIMQLNERMKAKGISMPRKAMRTKHNESWLLKDLLTEIEAEHAYFQTLEDIQKLLQASSTLCIEEYTQESWKVYETAFYQAYEVLQKQSKPEIAKAALTALQKAKQMLVKK